MTAGGFTYKFKLRRGAKFHDGAEVTTEDVPYSIERILARKKGAAALLAAMVWPGTTKAFDKSTVQFTLTKPASIFMAARTAWRRGPTITASPTGPQPMTSSTSFG